MDHGLNGHCPKGLCPGECPAKYIPIHLKLEDFSRASFRWADQLDNNTLVWIITNFSQVENSVSNNFNKYVEKFPFF
jgi:SPX domain protein involved in polyphosphate accumulation